MFNQLTTQAIATSGVALQNVAQPGGNGGRSWLPHEAPDAPPVDSRLTGINQLLKLPMPPKNIFTTGDSGELFIVIDEKNRYKITSFVEALAILTGQHLNAMVSTSLDNAFNVHYDNMGRATVLSNTANFQLDPRPERKPVDIGPGPLGNINSLPQNPRNISRIRSPEEAKVRTVRFSAIVDSEGNFTRQRTTPLESFPDMGPAHAITHEIALLREPKTLLILRNLLNQFTNSYLGDISTHQLYAQYLNRLLFETRNPDIPSTCLLTIESWDPDILARMTGNARITLERVLQALEESKGQPFGANMSLHLEKPNERDLTMLLDYYRQSRNLSFDPSMPKLMSRANMSLVYWKHILDNAPTHSVLTPETLNNSGLCELREKPTTWQEDFENLVGMDDFKRRLYDIKLAHEKGKLGAHPNLNFCFLGPTGTGKTEAARILGKFLNDIGVLKKGHLIEKSKAGIVAGFVGHTGLQTRKLLEDSRNGVFFIDEAHAFAKKDSTDTTHNPGFDNDFLTEIIPEMENGRGDRAIVFAGYPEGIQTLLASDEGFRGRFPKENIIEFKPYTNDELYSIFKKMARKEGFALDHATSCKITRIINGMPKGSKSFANAREMRQLFESMRIKSAPRDEKILRVEDIPATYNEYDVQQITSIEELEERFEGLVGLEEVKERLKGMFMRVNLDKSRGKSPSSITPFIFEGNPGTGKTTIARIMGSMYQGLGLLKSSQVHEYTKADVVAMYEGQTAKKIRNAVEAAIDGVFFLDEAYSIAREERGFGMEAMDELVKLIEQYKDRILFIFAGYPKEMNGFIASNPGLQSRLPEIVQFKDFTQEELIRILHIKLADQNAVISDPKITVEDYQQLLSSLTECNARTVANAADNIITRHAKRTNGSGIFDGNNNLVINRFDLLGTS